MQDSGGEKREEPARGLVEKGVVMPRSGGPVRISAEERGAQRFHCRRKRRSWRGSGVVREYRKQKDEDWACLGCKNMSVCSAVWGRIWEAVP